MSNQADARRRAETALRNAKSSGSDKKTIGQLQAQVDAASAAERRAKSSSGGAASRALGW